MAEIVTGTPPGKGEWHLAWEGIAQWGGGGTWVVFGQPYELSWTRTGFAKLWHTDQIWHLPISLSSVNSVYHSAALSLRSSPNLGIGTLWAITSMVMRWCRLLPSCHKPLHGMFVMLLGQHKRLVLAY